MYVLRRGFHRGLHRGFRRGFCSGFCMALVRIYFDGVPASIPTLIILVVIFYVIGGDHPL